MHKYDIAITLTTDEQNTLLEALSAYIFRERRMEEWAKKRTQYGQANRFGVSASIAEDIRNKIIFGERNV